MPNTGLRQGAPARKALAGAGRALTGRRARPCRDTVEETPGEGGVKQEDGHPRKAGTGAALPRA